MKKTDQMQTWSTDFGQDYTARNLRTTAEMDKLFRANLGVGRFELNHEFLDDLDRDLSILEVGSNVGTQLMILQEMGFKNLTGVELQFGALELAQERSHGIGFGQATAFNLPFKDSSFDLVFTSGVLIHIHPDDVGIALSEIYRCARHYIWGYEYYSPSCESITYRGQANLLWKADFAGLYRQKFANLETVKERRYPYLNADAEDSMFLLRKTGL